MTRPAWFPRAVSVTKKGRAVNRTRFDVTGDGDQAIIGGGVVVEGHEHGAGLGSGGRNAGISGRDMHAVMGPRGQGGDGQNGREKQVSHGTFL